MNCHEVDYREVTTTESMLVNVQVSEMRRLTKMKRCVCVCVCVKIGRFHFSNLCNIDLGASDYQAVAQQFDDTVVID